MKTLRVGVIGANAERGWARESHIPAIRHVDGLELAAVASKGQAAADSAAAAFGVAKAYGDAGALIRDPDIDLVTIATTLPMHQTLIEEALAANKHVYSEYPLGVGIAESQELAAAQQRAGVHAAIGLQARGNSAVRRAASLIAAGALGRLLAIRVYSPTIGFGARTQPAEAYTEDPETGVNLVTIQGAHTLDLVIALMGGFTEISALATRQYPTITVGAGAPQRRRTFDHLLVQACLSSGAAASIEVIGGRPVGTSFQLEVVGDGGTLTLDGGAPRGFQADRLALALNGNLEGVTETGPGLADGAANVATIYSNLRDDIARGTRTIAGFPHAVRLARLIDAAMISSEDGRRVPAADWPKE